MPEYIFAMIHTKQLRVINVGLVISFFTIYLEWGHSNSSFIFEIMFELFKDKNDDLGTLTHPIIMPGIAGMILLIISAFKKKPNKVVNLIGLILLGIIASFILFVGVLAMNIKIIASTLPFLSLAIVFFLVKRRIKNKPA